MKVSPGNTTARAIMASPKTSECAGCGRTEQDRYLFRDDQPDGIHWLCSTCLNEEAARQDEEDKIMAEVLEERRDG